MYALTHKNLLHTSVSISLKHSEKLKNTAEQLQISVNELIIILLRASVLNLKTSLWKSKGKHIKYQSRTKDYLALNLYIPQRDYDTFISARQYYKVSVSWLVAYALDNILEDVIYKILHSQATNNNILNIYLILHTSSMKKHGKKLYFKSILKPHTQ